MICFSGYPKTVLMGNTDSIPVFSQTKSLVQVVSGDTDGAKETQKTFFETCIIASQVTSLVQCLNGDNEAARKTQIKFLKSVEIFVDSVPVVGHIKGGIHYAIGQKEKGHSAMKSSSGTVVSIAAGVGGTMVAGPIGGASSAVAASKCFDATVTLIDTAANGYRNDGRPRFYGSLNAADKICRSKSSSGEVFDFVLEIGLNAFGGAYSTKVDTGLKGFAKSVGNEIKDSIPKFKMQKKFARPTICYQKDTRHNLPTDE